MNGFNTFEKQDKVLLGLNSGSNAAAAMRILQQQGFAVQTFTAEHEVTPAGLLQLLADKAAELDCAFIATGHYARIEVDGEGLSHLLPAADAEADQSAALAGLPQEVLAKLVLPLGEFTKAEVAEMLEGRYCIENSSVVFDGCIWVFGGESEYEMSLKSAEKYEPQTNKWIELP